MHKETRIPAIQSGAMIREALFEMTSKGLGMTAIIDKSGTLLGIYTDGDLRRTMDQKLDIQTTPIDQVMTTHCTTATPELLVEEALQIMDRKNINGLFVVDAEQKLVGALNMLDLLHAKAV